MEKIVCIVLVLLLTQTFCQKVKTQIISSDTLFSADSLTVSTISYEDLVVESKIDEYFYDQSSFCYVNDQPKLIYQGKMIYRKKALKNGRVHIVWAKIFIDKKGNPRRATIIKSESKLFNRPALYAAITSKFKPATIQNKALGCWVVIPYKLRIPFQ